jgi:crinkler effector protein
MFTVEIPKTKNASILKDLIKEKKAPHLDHVAASDLDLWKVNFPIDDLPTKNFLTDGPKLGSGELLSVAFPSELDIRYIHVTVYVPVRSEYYVDSWHDFAHFLSLEVVDEGKELGRRDQISNLEKSANVFFFFSSCP